jgi:hypothetical protein
MSEHSQSVNDEVLKKITRGPSKPLTKPEIDKILHYLQVPKATSSLKAESAPHRLKGKENRNKRKTWQNSTKQFDKPEEAGQTFCYDRLHLFPFRPYCCNDFLMQGQAYRRRYSSFTSLKSLHVYFEVNLVFE